MSNAQTTVCRCPSYHDFGGRSVVQISRKLLVSKHDSCQEDVPGSWDPPSHMPLELVADTSRDTSQTVWGHNRAVSWSIDAKQVEEIPSKVGLTTCVQNTAILLGAPLIIGLVGGMQGSTSLRARLSPANAQAKEKRLQSLRSPRAGHLLVATVPNGSDPAQNAGLNFSRTQTETLAKIC